MKTCSKCKETKPATNEYFARCKAKRDGLHSLCKPCAAEYGRQWRATNAESLAQKKRAYALAQKDNRAKYFRYYYLAHREQMIARAKEWRERNPDQSRQYFRKYHPAWRAANKEATRAIVRRRRAIRLKAQGSHTAEDIERQYKAQRGKCYYCAIMVGDKYHADHVIPLSRGGSDGPENIVIACPACNQSKNNKLPHEWAQGGRLL